ncbi:MAG: hypothetical protein U0792_24710 [Gemmataceae bacterium]
MLVSKLGEGSFGQVFLARQVSLGREVALKVSCPAADELASDTTSTVTRPTSPSDARSRNEGQVLAGLEHDHIVKVFSEFTDKATGTCGLCSQYVPGADLGGHHSAHP